MVGRIALLSWWMLRETTELVLLPASPSSTIDANTYSTITSSHLDHLMLRPFSSKIPDQLLSVIFELGDRVKVGALGWLRIDGIYDITHESISSCQLK
jgi:hypothetical protein